MNQAHVKNVDAMTSISISCSVCRPYTIRNWVHPASFVLFVLYISVASVIRCTLCSAQTFVDKSDVIEHAAQYVFTFDVCHYCISQM
jgi:hypothetical protein